MIQQFASILIIFLGSYSFLKVIINKNNYNLVFLKNNNPSDLKNSHKYLLYQNLFEISMSIYIIFIGILGYLLSIYFLGALGLIIVFKKLFMKYVANSMLHQP